VQGTIKFAGTAPKPVKIDMSQDPACKGSNASEDMVVDNGNLANVFVYVKDGLDNYSFEAPKDAVKINQEGCRYHPHVLGVMAGQTVEVINDDPTTHNIHPTPKDNREWNESQPPKAAPIDKSFARQEIMLPVKCNQHPWMKMYISVVKTPFFAVTDKDGKFEIKGLPPGTYTLAAVQEKLGEQDQKITIAPKGSQTVDFTFKPGGAPAAGMGD
jgi:plastocyanin